MTPADSLHRWRNGAALFIGGAVLGLALSKFGALMGFELGKSYATANIEREQEIRLQHFEDHRMESCLAWWFKDSATRIKDAQFFMCQNRRKWQ